MWFLYITLKAFKPFSSYKIQCFFLFYSNMILYEVLNNLLRLLQDNDNLERLKIFSLFSASKSPSNYPISKLRICLARRFRLPTRSWARHPFSKPRQTEERWAEGSWEENRPGLNRIIYWSERLNQIIGFIVRSNQNIGFIARSIHFRSWSKNQITLDYIGFIVRSNHIT